MKDSEKDLLKSYVHSVIQPMNSSLIMGFVSALETGEKEDMIIEVHETTYYEIKLISDFIDSL